MIQTVSTFEPAAFAVAAVASFIASNYAKQLPDWAQALFMLLCIVFFAFAAVDTVYFVAYHSTSIYKHFRQAQAITPDAVLMERARFLTTDQAKIVQNSQYAVKQRMIPGNLGPLKYIIAANGEEVPQTFVKEFFEACDSRTLVPVREYSDSQRRVYALALTDTLVGLGYAARGAGNQRSVWLKSREEAIKHFGAEG